MYRMGSNVAVSAWLILALMGLAGPALAKDQGKALYDRSCKVCHGADGRGDGPAAKAFRTPPPNFLDGTFWKPEADQAIAQSIEKGKGSMPAIRLSPEQIAKVVEYMNRAFKTPALAQP